MDRREVLITGIGPITAFGVGVDPLWRALRAGESALRPIARFDASGFACPVAGELPDDMFAVRDVVPKSYRKATKVMARDIELAVGAADAAVRDAALVTRGTDPDAEPTLAPDRFGCHVGAGLIAADIDELTQALATSGNERGEFDMAEWGRKGMQNLTPLWMLKYLPNMLACHVTIIHDCRGPSNTITCAEASALLSLGESMRTIERGAADACLSGGAESKVNPMGLLRQQFAERLAAVGPDEGPTAVRPFAPDARGTVLGEGGGILVLESRESAERRGRAEHAYAVCAGYGASQSYAPDAVCFEVDRDGEGIAQAIETALDEAGVRPEDIDAVVPFASGIPGADRAELGALRRVFGDRAAKLPVVTTIPNVGNLGAGAGAVAVAVAAKAIKERTLPARINARGVEGLDADACDARPADLDHVLVTITSMGGQNAAAVLRRADLARGERR